MAQQKNYRAFTWDSFQTADNNGICEFLHIDGTPMVYTGAPFDEAGVEMEFEDGSEKTVSFNEIRWTEIGCFDEGVEIE